MSKPTFNRSRCSFCARDDVPCISKHNKSICVMCVHDVGQSMGTLDVGDIRCLGCGFTGGFHAHYGPVTVTLSKEGVDEDGFAQYRLVRTYGKWDIDVCPDRFTCSACDKPVAVWMVTNNRYAMDWFPKLSENESKRGQ